MRIRLKPFAVALFLSGAVAPALAAAQTTSNATNSQIERISSQTKALEAEVSRLQQEVRSLKNQQQRTSHSAIRTRHATNHKGTQNQKAATNTSEPTDEQETPNMSRAELAKFIHEQREYLPFDLDVPGQAFVSTGPYVGVPFQFDGSDLIVNSPSVNTDVQLLGIRKHIMEQLMAMGGELFKEPYHSHLLLSGVAEAQAGYLRPGTGASQTDIDVTNVSLDAFFLGPSPWTLGFIEFTYDNSTPANSIYTSTNSYRVANSRVLINKAFITIGDFSRSPFYGSVGQFYVPFGTYSSVMVSDMLSKLLGRTKERSILVGYQQQDKNAFYASTYIFRGDSHTGSSSKVNNAGINIGYRFHTNWVDGNIGGGALRNLADSGGMQLGTGFSSNEKIVHRVAGYDLRGIVNIGDHVNLIAEYVTAASRFNPNDMSFNGHGAKPWALDTQAAYSFYMLDHKPTSVGIGYAKSSQALAMGLPLDRYSLVLNTSLWRNTLQSLELRRDINYAKSDTAVGAGTTVSPATGKADNAITAQFDYYF